MNHRAEIDGLRAIAVIPVILYHAGFGLFQGGFVGVDVFFVISGFLITSIIVKAKDEGNFSLVEFYERRARRLLPAFFVMVAFCIPIAWLVLLPDQLKLFGYSVFSSAFFSANILYSLRGDYFSRNSHDDPLSHTWSLSVEEQFYLVFPLMLLIAMKWIRPMALTLVCLLALASLLSSVWLGHTDWNRGFYFAYARAWELLAGCAMAMFVYKKKLPANQWASLAGLMAIMGSYLAFDSRMTQLPGLLNVVPVIGTLLVIGFGRQGTVTYKLLSNPALVGIGLISYSAYLWHQPILAFGRLIAHAYTDIDVRSPSLLITLCALSLVIAGISWRWVEKPCREMTSVLRWKGILMAMGLVAISSTGFALALINTNGMVGRFDVAQSVVDSIDFDYRRDECFDLDLAHQREDWTCLIGDQSKDVSLYIIGDSHAYAMLAGMDIALGKMGIAAQFAGLPGCIPLLGVHLLERDEPLKDCYGLKERFFEHVKAEEGRNVVLIGAWSYYSGGGLGRGNTSHISTSEVDKPSIQTSRAAFVSGVGKTLDQYESIGIDPIFIAQVPDQKLHPLQHYQQMINADVTALRSMGKDKHYGLQAFAMKSFNDRGADLIDPAVFLCNDLNCPIGTESYSYYYDDDHLSVMGSKRIARFLASELSKRIQINRVVKVEL